ncbi:hypothetical protein TEA_001055 [Camellia sinensis var. sinensis]|uniref:GDSL esterase/lipase n=1 Tax=Camellia sinensis var. sinensis TaxID=542762 RepID=A0A4V3WQV0_CAMSN|nr:hypothetical protein TEA_001055 [Camellia sinensis var. sinensis]
MVPEFKSAQTTILAPLEVAKKSNKCSLISSHHSQPKVLYKPISALTFLIAELFVQTPKSCSIYPGALAPQAEARAFFVFGDSLVDSGNNDYLATTARADNPPYGIDYPTHRPTGRFSNGLNIPDILS